MLAAALALVALVALLTLVLRQGRGQDKSEQRLQLLEAKVEWLYRESQRLRAELAILKGEAPEHAEAGDQPAAQAAPPVPTPAEAATAEAAGPASALPVGEIPAAGEAPAAPAWRQKLLAGNPLAKVGVVLLFFGVASALRLAADYGYLPVQLRLVFAAAGGLAMIAFGWARARQGEHAAFGIAIQGGGFAILYLIVYFMLARYSLLGPAPSFVLFALLGVACMALAAAQDGAALAVFGLAGAFFAPVLAASGRADPLPLFAYFTLLNAFILGVSWFKSWRALNVAGFLLTLGVGMAWAVEHYHSGYYAVTQGFLLFFWLLYSAAPMLMAWLRAPGSAGWSDAALVFGTPLAGFALQSRLAADRYELAWAALAAALYYCALWLPLYRRAAPELRRLEQSQLGLAVAFASLAVPLAFGVQVTAAFWALEGGALVWFGAAPGRRLARAAGIALQGAAGAYFLFALDEMGTRPPIVNDATLGMLLLAGAGYASARLLAGGAAALALLWAEGWWLGAGLAEIERNVAPAIATVLALVWLAATLWLADRQGRALAWPAARQASLLPAFLLFAWLVASNLSEPGAVIGLPYLPVLNAFDMAQLAALAALHAWRRGDAGAVPRHAGWLALPAFVWLSCLGARIAHHWGGVPFDWDALWHSTLLQAMLTLLWTLMAIAAMIRAAQIGRRTLWQGGFALLAAVGAKLMLVDLANAGTLLWTGSLIGVALLVLAAAYFAPVPPRQTE